MMKVLNSVIKIVTIAVLSSTLIGCITHVEPKHQKERVVYHRKVVRAPEAPVARQTRVVVSETGQVAQRPVRQTRVLAQNTRESVRLVEREHKATQEANSSARGATAKRQNVESQEETEVARRDVKHVKVVKNRQGNDEVVEETMPARRVVRHVHRSAS